jgi:hypothetical protein
MDETLQCEFDGRFESWQNAIRGIKMKGKFATFAVFNGENFEFYFIFLKARFELRKKKKSWKDKTFFLAKHCLKFHKSFMKFSGRWSLVNQDETDMNANEQQTTCVCRSP